MTWRDLEREAFAVESDPEKIREERWIPVHVSGIEWSPRSRDEAERCMADYPRDWTFKGEEDYGPNGLVGIRGEERYVTKWAPIPEGDPNV